MVEGSKEKVKKNTLFEHSLPGIPYFYHSANLNIVLCDNQMLEWKTCWPYETNPMWNIYVEKEIIFHLKLV